MNKEMILHLSEITKGTQLDAVNLKNTQIAL